MSNHDEDGNLIIELDDDQQDALEAANTEGQGGFQSLMERLQDGYDEDENTLTISEKDQERLPRYADDYGNGGWEDQIEAIVGDELDDLREAREDD